jgi:hypothetical protein
LTTNDQAPNDHFLVPEIEEQKAYVPDTVNTFVVDEYNDFVDNPVLFYATAWTVGSLNAVVTDDLFRSYLTLSVSSLSMLAKKLSNFMFCAADLRVTVAVQGNSVAMGKMVISFDPTPNGASQTTVTNHVPVAQATRCMIIPHIEIDPAESKTYTIDLPAPTIWGLFSLYSNAAYKTNEVLGSYRMKQHVINPLGSGTAVVPSIDIAVYLSLVRPKMVAATGNTTYTMTSALKKEKTDGSGGVISSYFKKASSVASVVSKVPVPFIAEAATVFGGVAEATGNFLSWFGYSKPLVQDVGHTRVTTEANWSLIDNAIQAQPMSWRSNASVGLSGASSPLYDPRESVLAELASRKALIRIFSVTTVTAPNTLVGTLDVDPMKNRVLDDPAIASSYELTPLSFVCYPYHYWRGDLTYEFEFVGSVFHRATFVVLYDPGSGTVSGAINRYMSVLQHWTFQVNGHVRESITIPWKQFAGMREVTAPSAATVTATGVNTHSNGQIHLCLLNAVTTNGSTDPYRVNIYVSANNLRLGASAHRVYAPQVIVPPTLVADDFRETSEEEEVIEYTSIKSSDDTGFFRQYFGEEQAHTLKELANRQTPLATIDWNPTTGAVRGTYLVIPNGPLGPADFLASSFPGATIYAAGNALVDYLSGAFVGVRGSYDYSFFPNGGSSLPMVMCNATLDYGLTKPFSDVEYEPMPSSGWGPITMAYMAVNPSLQINAPYYYAGMFRPTYQTSFCSNDCVRFRSCQTTQVIAPLHRETVLRSGGDDFMFVGFRGLPVTSFTF